MYDYHVDPLSGNEATQAHLAQGQAHDNKSARRHEDQERADRGQSPLSQKPPGKENPFLSVRKNLAKPFVLQGLIP